MFKLKMKAQSGFTLVELMVVVAIIGILSAIAIPQFSTYQAKSRTSEAKLALAAIYSAEVAFQGEADLFASCLFDMGYRPASFTNATFLAGTTAPTGAPERYYTVGFNADSISNPAAAGTVQCNRASRIYRGIKNANAVTTLPLAPAIPAVGNTFTAQAVGTVDKGYIGNAGGTTGDSWTINQNKTLVHTRNGY